MGRRRTRKAQDRPRGVLVTGARDYADYDRVASVLDAELAKDPGMFLIHGGAKGADSLADRWSSRNDVLTVVHKPEWSRYGKGAGPIRNKAMLQHNPRIVHAFHDDIASSRGTRNMVTQAAAAKHKVRIHSKDGRVGKSAGLADLGEVSKGLPSSLRWLLDVNAPGASAKRLSLGPYAKERLLANQFGREAAARAPESRSGLVEAGRDAKEHGRIVASVQMERRDSAAASSAKRAKRRSAIKAASARRSEMRGLW